MVALKLTNQTSQNLSLGSGIVPGRRYAIAVVGTAVAFSVQYKMPALGFKTVQGYSALTPTDANTVLQFEIVLATENVQLAFASAPGTYQVILQEIIVEQH